MHPSDAPVMVSGLLMACLFAAYFMLRPIRETMGLMGGVENLQGLFTGTFIATLATVPLIGWLTSRVKRRLIVPWFFGSFTVCLLGFAAVLHIRPDSLWAARAFYIWLSVFSLLAVSQAWSTLADIFSAAEAKLIFARIAVGASIGGLTGLLLGMLLVTSLGHAGLLLLVDASPLG